MEARTPDRNENPRATPLVGGRVSVRTVAPPRDLSDITLPPFSVDAMAPRPSAARTCAYPPPLQSAEQNEITARRRAAGIDVTRPAVGFALSGGGIRSATFCLGLFQSLARQRLIRDIDVLSTVSGGGYFGSFLGAAFARDRGSVDTVEDELANNRSWAVTWLRENGRFLSPNGSGDNWLTAAVALRNWCALQVVLLTFCFMLLGLGALLRTGFSSGTWTRPLWLSLERFLWNNDAINIWWSPWLLLPLIPFFGLMVPTGTLYWLTQASPCVAAVRRVFGLFNRRARAMAHEEFTSYLQHGLTRGFMLGLVPALALTGFAVLDSLGQTAYLHWSRGDFDFPSLWAVLTGAGAGAFGFATKVTLYLERLLGKRRFRVPFDVIALGLALAWLLLIFLALSVVTCGFAWQWAAIGQQERFHPMSAGWHLAIAVVACIAASWIFSRAFGFVNLSSMQQMYAARLARAYLGATNPERRRHANHNMTDLIPGDDLGLEDYAPQKHGGPLHLINVTVNETLSGKTQIERRDRKGLAMAVGPCGLSVGIDSHALWSSEAPRAPKTPRLDALWATPTRAVAPIACDAAGREFHALCGQPNPRDAANARQPIEALALGRWVAISGAAFTTGTGANTELGLSLLLGLANVRLGYWWNSGVVPGQCEPASTRPNLIELVSRVTSRLLPVQFCLMNEFFARFHGPARRHWYLSDGGHFENTACYELVRRRLPFMVCVDAGQDADYEFADLANLVRKARIDFDAEIQIARRASDLATDDPGVRFPMPTLEELVHPSLLDVIGTPDDFVSLRASHSADEQDHATEPTPPERRARAHALLARVHYLDTDEFSWLLVIKPSLMGDEAVDVVQYQRRHPLFPQEPTSDQYFDEAQWESYRKLGEHIGTELFTPPKSGSAAAAGPTWSPSQLRAPSPPSTDVAASGIPAWRGATPSQVPLASAATPGIAVEHPGAGG